MIMSNKEFAIQLINQMSEYKLGYVVAYLQGLNADEAADDAYCAQLLDNYNNSADKGDFVSFDDALKLCEVDFDAIQN